MEQNFAKITGKITKGIKIRESSIEVKLIFPLKAALPHLVFLSNNQSEEVNVILPTHKCPLILKKKTCTSFTSAAGR
ncbi:hypothetical protein J2TS6_48070 [Paenibacillus albilobatus]|uniref:Uncharacterized protein n=1 Tax=Paenibacillus albilobatus TaxID=2716884 RepID=A0A919XIR2_9BACL|nr:hypothetical protein J2TS6_48070 [Paenibacillus albilobatus]